MFHLFRPGTSGLQNYGAVFLFSFSFFFFFFLRGEAQLGLSLFVCLFVCLYILGPKKIFLGRALSTLFPWSKVMEAPVLELFWFLRYWSMISMIKERKYIVLITFLFL